MIHKMIAAPIASATPQPPSSAGTPNDGGGLSSTAARDQHSFDALMAAAAAPAQGVPVAFMSQALARTDTPFGQAHAGARSARLATLRQSDADSRAGGGSRISGADRSAIQPEATRVSESAGERGGNNTADPSRGAPDNATRAERLVGSAVRTNMWDEGSSKLSARDAAPPSVGVHASSRTDRATDPQFGSGERSPFDQTAARRSASAAPLMSPERLAESPSSSRAADQVGKVSAVRGSGGSEARSGSQGASDGVAQLREKGGRLAPEHGVNETRKQNQPRPGRLAAYERVSEAIRTMKNGKDWVTRIRLDPPSLGHLRIEIRMSGDTVRVRLSAETADAQRTLTSQLSELRASLEEHGLRLERIDITTPSRGDVTSDQASRDDSERTPAPHRDVGDGGPRREDRETNRREDETLGSNRDESVLMHGGDGDMFVGDGWLDVHA